MVTYISVTQSKNVIHCVTALKNWTASITKFDKSTNRFLATHSSETILIQDIWTHEKDIH